MDITLHTPETIYAPRHLPSWLLLAASAGFVNGWAFLMCEQFVTHVTGTVTRLGLEWPVIGLMLEYAVIVVNFVAGAAASVLWIQARALRGRKPRWATPLLFVVLILVAVALVGKAGLFGRFGGTHAADPPPVVLLSLLAFAMGLQNAAVASTTGLAVRTTHLTGPATDLGIHLGVAALATAGERRSALLGAALRAGKIAAFLLGAGLSYPLTRAFDYLALVAPAAGVFVAVLLSFSPQWSPSDFPFRRSGHEAARADL
jgi:uncharacterized membrane protein YoaK (UPF0700 family)